jgi:hypothetical protein
VHGVHGRERTRARINKQIGEQEELDTVHATERTTSDKRKALEAPTSSLTRYFLCLPRPLEHTLVKKPSNSTRREGTDSNSRRKGCLNLAAVSARFCQIPCREATQYGRLTASRAYLFISNVRGSVGNVSHRQVHGSDQTIYPNLSAFSERLENTTQKAITCR